MATEFALGEIPNGMPIIIYSNPTATIAKVSHKSRRLLKLKKQCMYSSLLDWMCVIVRQKIQNRTVPTTIKWIKGNERADSLAKDAKFAAPEPLP